MRRSGAEIRTVGDIMSRNPIVLREDEDLHAAEQLMQQASVHHLPVVHQGRLVGLLSQMDFLAASVSCLADISLRERKEFLQSIPVVKIMRRQVVSAVPSLSLGEACSLMIDHVCDCLPIVETGLLIGIITRTDLLKLVAALSVPRDRVRKERKADE